MDALNPIAGADAEQHQDAVRLKIATAAQRLFATKGYDKTSVGDIARDVGMSPPNLYRYHRNKQAIGMAVVSLFHGEIERVRQDARAMNAPSVEERLRGYVSATAMFTVGHLREAPKLVELADMLFGNDDGRAFIESQRREHIGNIADLIAEGVRTGEFAETDTEAAARAVAMATELFQSPSAMTQHGLDDAEGELAIVLDLLCAGLRAGVRQPGIAS